MDDGFDFFWSKYPRKVAKPDAVMAWKKLKPADREAIVERLDAWIAHYRAGRPQEDFMRFLPYPGPWLRRRRWEDELPEGEALGAAARAQAAYMESRRKP